MAELMIDAIVDQQRFDNEDIVGFFISYALSSHFIFEITRVNAFDVYIETLLFSVYHFLWTRSFSSTLYLLWYENASVLAAYLLADYKVLSCSIIHSILLRWLLQYQEDQNQENLHPCTLVIKCSIFFVVKYALAAPERWIPLFWCFNVLYYYIFHFDKKSVHDAYLLFVLTQILIGLAIISNECPRVLWMILLSLLYVQVLYWLEKKFYFFRF